MAFTEGRIIRRMSEADIAQVAELESEIFTIPWSYSSLKDAAANPDNVYLVYIEDGQVAGHCGMWCVSGEGNITNVAVKEGFRRRGIARALLEELLRTGIDEHSVDVFFLEVRQSNAAAKALYSSLGFKTLGIRKNFYEKPLENADIMSKIISRQ